MTASPRLYRAHAVRWMLSAVAALSCMVTAAGCSDQHAQNPTTAEGQFYGPAITRPDQHARNPTTMTRPDGVITGTLILEYSVGSGSLKAVVNETGRAKLEIVSAGHVVASVVTGPSGGFRVRVPAGRYQFHLGRSRGLCATDTPPAPVTFSVRPGRANQVQVFCATRGGPAL
jgi:hypothetical protein